MKYLVIVIWSCLLALIGTPANAAAISFYYAGVTDSVLTDGTNYFGLGNEIAAGNEFSLNVTFDPAIGTTYTPFTGMLDNYAQCCNAAGYYPPGPTSISTIDLVLNGVQLSMNGSLFDEHTTHAKKWDINFKGFSSQHDIAFVGSSAQGDRIELFITRFFGFSDGNGYPATASLDLRGSISLLLLASDGSPLVNLTSVAGQNVFGFLPTDVPLPAALPLFSLCLGGLGIASRRRLGSPPQGNKHGRGVQCDSGPS